jgi:hypothetical protein
VRNKKSKLRKENRSSSEVQQRLFLFFTDVDVLLTAFFQLFSVKKRLTFRWKLEKMHNNVTAEGL